MKQRFEGRNLEEALTAAASALGVERYQLDYHVIVEKRGFLGGVKRIVIEAEADEDRQPETNESRDALMLASSADLPVGETPRTGGSDRPRGRGKQEGRRGGRDRSGRDRRTEPRRPEPRRRREAPSEPAPEQGPQSAFASEVAAWCGQLIDLGGFSLEVRTFEEQEGQVTIRFYGGDIELLTEKGGSLLDSFQVLATKSFSEREGSKDLELDVSGFKEQRTVRLEAKAREAADQVRQEGREKVMNPMSPVERRIVHMVLADDPDVETVSRGEGFLKRVVIRRRRARPAEAEQEST